MRRIRHHPISEQVGEINAVLRGHYAYYGVAGNLRALFKVYRAVERYWRKMLRSRSWAGRAPHLGRTSTRSSNGHRCCDQNCASHTGSCRHSQCCEPTAEERGAGNPHATFCGNRGRATASGDPVGCGNGALPNGPSYRAHPRLYQSGRSARCRCQLSALDPGMPFCSQTPSRKRWDSETVELHHLLWCKFGR